MENIKRVAVAALAGAGVGGALEHVNHYRDSEITKYLVEHKAEFSNALSPIDGYINRLKTLIEKETDSDKKVMIQNELKAAELAYRTLSTISTIDGNRTFYQEREYGKDLGQALVHKEE